MTHLGTIRPTIGLESDGEVVDEDNPLPVNPPADATPTDHQLIAESDVKCLLREIIIELRILNTYNALGHDVEIKEEDTYEN